MPRPRRAWYVTKLLLLGMVGLALVFVSTRARADEGQDDEPPVVAVIPFGAPLPAQAAASTAACEQALSRIRGLKLIKAEVWNKEAKASGQGDDLEAMAKRLAADVLVTGTLSQRAPGTEPESGRPWGLSVDVFDEHLTPLGSIKLDLYQPVIGPAASLLLEEELSRLIRPAVGLGDKPAAASTDPEPSPQDADKEGPDLTMQVEGLTPTLPQAPKKLVRKPWRSALEAQLGVIVSARDLTCGPASAVRRNLTCQTAIFPLDAGGGIRLDATFRPLELLNRFHPALAGLGIGLTLEAPFWGDRVQANPVSNLTNSFPTKELRFEGGLRWRWKVGVSPLLPVLEAGLQFGYHSFSLSSGAALPPYPDAAYQYVLPTIGLGGYITERFHLRGAVSVLGILSPGPITEATDKNNQSPFGTGGALGLRGALEAQVALRRGFWLVAGGGVEQVALSFDGKGCTKVLTTQAQCTSPAVNPVQSANDLYLNLWIGAAYRY